MELTLNCSPIELEGISQHLGVPGLNLDIGLVHMKSDADVVALATSLPPTRIAKLYVEHIDKAVLLDEEVVHEEELYSDESTEDEMHSDGSYSMSNDDALYETFVDDEVEFRGTEHTDPSIYKCLKSYTNRNVNSSMIAKRYMDDLRINPSMPIKAFKERVRKEIKVDVSKSQLYREKRKAAMLIYGDNIEQYGRLWDYCEELKRSNTCSTVVMDTPLDEEIGQPRFNRLYLFCSMQEWIHTWLQKLIGVDGWHLKGLYVGQLLTVIGVDPNDAMYPIASAIVKKENKDTLMWFFELLRIDVGITPNNEPEFTFINDRQKRLLPALAETFPSVEHIHCCKHLLSNFMKTLKGLSLEEKFWKYAKATHAAQFQHAMEVMNKENPDACKWLEAEPISVEVTALVRAEINDGAGEVTGLGNGSNTGVGRVGRGSSIGVGKSGKGSSYGLGCGGRGGTTGVSRVGRGSSIGVGKAGVVGVHTMEGGRASNIGMNRGGRGSNIGIGRASNLGVGRGGRGSSIGVGGATNTGLGRATSTVEGQGATQP
ncbi:hypothetical protein RHSIM_Rhsim01G0182800 [Rhododendron simsii]|uniref:MULE transposase domain-containing protein n=1 Tax=Rhododendron simsii TaxID=118357 RepID=A0A834LVD8_RHOSS|nr:hypothetical protein RHSIM_Rhsim01G0182800 [Rhododendron simsii]